MPAAAHASPWWASPNVCPSSWLTATAMLGANVLNTWATGPDQASPKPLMKATPPALSNHPLFLPMATRVPFPLSAASPSSSVPGGSSVVTSTSHALKSSATCRQTATMLARSAAEKVALSLSRS